MGSKITFLFLKLSVFKSYFFTCYKSLRNIFQKVCYTFYWYMHNNGRFLNSKNASFINQNKGQLMRSTAVG